MTRSSPTASGSRMTFLPSLLRRLPGGLVWPPWVDWVFALRTTASGLLSLSIAFALGLSEPQWAIMTVFIVAQPFTGMVLAKGFFRAVGTVLGAGVAILAVRLLGGHPLLFLVAMAAWLAFCTFVSGMLRNAESYGAVLAGYTAGIIAYPALNEPALVGAIAQARCTEIILGMVCAGAASLLILPRRIRPVLQDRLSACLGVVARTAAAALAGEPAAAQHALQRGLIADAQALDALRATALIEAPGLRRRGRHIRHVLGYILSAMSAARTLHTHVSGVHGGAGPRVQPLLTEAAHILRAIAARPNDTASARRALAAIEARVAAARSILHGADDIAAAAALMGLAELLDTLHQAVIGFAGLLDGQARPLGAAARARFGTHQPPGRALRNAIRAGAAALLISLLWRLSGWAPGAGVVVIVAAITGLFATLPRPVEASLTFCRGTFYAVFPAFLLGQIVLVRLPGFLWIAVFTVPILVVAGLGMARPQRQMVATGFAVLFLALLAPGPEMHADMLPFLQGSAAVLGGILLCAAVFRFLLPSRAPARRQHLLAAMRADLLRLCSGTRLPNRLAFETRMYDRIGQILPELTADGAGDATLAGSLGAVTVGLELLRLRQPSSGAARLAPVTESLFARLAAALRTPPDPAGLRALVAETRTAAAHLAEAGPTTLEHAASLRVIAASLADHPVFFAAA